MPAPGTPLFVHFWSSGCPLCHEGAPSIHALRERFPSLAVIAVYQPRPDETPDRAAIARDAATLMRIDYPCAVDAAGALARAFDNPYAPGYYLFDADRRLRHRQMGNAGFDALGEILERAAVKASREREA